MPGKWFPTSFDRPPIPLGPAVQFNEFDIPADSDLDLTASASTFVIINPTSEDHLRGDIGSVLTRYLFRTSKASVDNRTLIIADGFSLPTRITSEEEDKSILVRVCMEGMIGNGVTHVVRPVSAILEDYLIRGNDDGFPSATTVAHNVLPSIGGGVAVTAATKKPKAEFMPLPGTSVTRSYQRGTSPSKGGTHVYNHIQLDNTYMVGRNYFTSKIDGVNPYFLAGVKIESTVGAGFSTEGSKGRNINGGSWLDITIAVYNARMPILDPRAY